MTPQNLAYVHDRIAAGAPIEFVEVEPRSVRRPPAPAFVFGEFPSALSCEYANRMHLHPVGVFLCRDAEVTPPYLIVQRGMVLCCAEANLHKAYVDELLAAGADPGRDRIVKPIGEPCAMIFGPGDKIFGHWMADFLAKFYFLERAGFNLSTTPFLLPSNIPQFALELFEGIGIRRNQILYLDADREIAACETLLLPTICHNGIIYSQVFRKTIIWLRQRVEARFGPLAAVKGPSRIFVSRRGGSRHLINRDEIERMAVEQGFVLVHPEQMPLIQQFSLFAAARQVIGEYGSALHNTIFSPPGTTVCALRGNALHPGFIQSGIAEAAGHRLGYVFGTNLSEEGDFRVDPADFGAALRALSTEPESLMGCPVPDLPVIAEDAEPVPKPRAATFTFRDLSLHD